VLLFRRQATVWRQGFDQSRLAVQGEATPLIDRIAIEASAKASHAFTASASNGVLAFRSSQGEMSQFTWFDRGGRLLETVGVPGNYRAPTISPDDKQLAFVRTDDQGDDIWIQDLSRQVLSRFTFDPGMESLPIWSPDGATILYFSNPDGSTGKIVKKNADGTGAEQLVVNASGIHGAIPAQVSPDGKLLFYSGSTGLSPFSIFVWPLAGEFPTPGRTHPELTKGQEPIPILVTAFNNRDPQISPDGHWMAYVSDETKRFEVYVQPFPPPGRKWQISSGGGSQPTWRADGKELFFVSGQKLQAVDMRLGKNFAIGTPHVLFEMRTHITTGGGKNYVPSRDGQRFLINSLLDATASPINVVLNWQEEPKRLVPTH
jgi:dipeptidyl aminopeptidase/acylaminoacyl peptidase